MSNNFYEYIPKGSMDMLKQRTITIQNTMVEIIYSLEYNNEKYLRTGTFLKKFMNSKAAIRLYKSSVVRNDISAFIILKMLEEEYANNTELLFAKDYIKKTKMLNTLKNYAEESYSKLLSPKEIYEQNKVDKLTLNATSIENINNTKITTSNIEESENGKIMVQLIGIEELEAESTNEFNDVLSVAIDRPTAVKIPRKPIRYGVAEIEKAALLRNMLTLNTSELKVYGYNEIISATYNEGIKHKNNFNKIVVKAISNILKSSDVNKSDEKRITNHFGYAGEKGSV